MDLLNKMKSIASFLSFLVNIELSTRGCFTFFFICSRSIMSFLNYQVPVVIQPSQAEKNRDRAGLTTIYAQSRPGMYTRGIYSGQNCSGIEKLLPMNLGENFTRSKSWKGNGLNIYPWQKIVIKFLLKRKYFFSQLFSSVLFLSFLLHFLGS